MEKYLVNTTGPSVIPVLYIDEVPSFWNLKRVKDDINAYPLGAVYTHIGKRTSKNHQDLELFDTVEEALGLCFTVLNEKIDKANTVLENLVALQSDFFIE